MCIQKPRRHIKFTDKGQNVFQVSPEISPQSQMSLTFCESCMYFKADYSKRTIPAKRTFRFYEKAKLQLLKTAGPSHYLLKIYFNFEKSWKVFFLLLQIDIYICLWATVGTLKCVCSVCFFYFVVCVSLHLSFCCLDNSLSWRKLYLSAVLCISLFFLIPIACNTSGNTRFTSVL